MRRCNRGLKKSLGVAILIAIATFSLADGMMVKRSSGTHLSDVVEAPIAIPSQRAVVKWQDGFETLIVESVISGPKGVYGWVVPLPNKPSFVKPVSPEYVSQSFDSMRPPATTGTVYTNPTTLAIYVIAVLLWLTAGYRYRNRGLSDRILYFVLEFVVMIAIGALLLFPVFAQSKESAKSTFEGEAPASSGAVAEDAAKLQVESMGTIGSYDVNVVTGNDSQAILQWFRNGNYQVPNLAKPEIEHYIKEGWVFLAAEIRKDRDEAWPAHPLKAVFPSDEPIYPMRLTGTQQEPLHLELLIIADEQAKVKGLGGWTSHDRGLTIGVSVGEGLEKETLSEWHDGLYAMAKYGKAATYLRGDLHPNQMKEDFQIEWKPFEPYRVDVWTKMAADSVVWNLFVTWFPLGGFLVAIVGLIYPEKFLQVLLGGILASIALSASLGLIWKSRRTIIDADAIRSYNASENYWGRNMMDRLSSEQVQNQRQELRKLPTIPRPK